MWGRFSAFPSSDSHPFRTDRGRSFKVEWGRTCEKSFSVDVVEKESSQPGAVEAELVRALPECELSRHHFNVRTQHRLGQDVDQAVEDRNVLKREPPDEETRGAENARRQPWRSADEAENKAEREKENLEEANIEETRRRSEGKRKRKERRKKRGERRTGRKEQRRGQDSETRKRTKMIRRENFKIPL
uniref:Uncharacterized protein n=1 Tax=Toxoplasma gondii TgCATBr9 TaxID=943120 RepID=A0A2T6IN25_TOXGO|nr:hypothetical protein TGBR9_383400 [Toxoplasma gondii TgCATBr9]